MQKTCLVGIAVLVVRFHCRDRHGGVYIILYPIVIVVLLVHVKLSDGPPDQPEWQKVNYMVSPNT